MQVDENNEPEQPGTPVPADDPEASDNSEIHFLELLCYTVLFFFFFCSSILNSNLLSHR